MEEFLFGLEVLPVTGAIGRRAGGMKAGQGHAGRTVSLADMLIAETALEGGLVVMTENVKDFSFPALQLWPTSKEH